MKSLYDIIAEQPFFQGLSQEHLRTLADNAMQTWFQSGEIIFGEGDLANRFYLIIEGRVVLESLIKNGESVVLQTIGKGELLGWSWLFSPYFWRLHARAMEPTEAIFFYGTHLREQCEINHNLGYELFKRISEVMMKRLQIARARHLDHLAECPSRKGANPRSAQARCLMKKWNLVWLAGLVLLLVDCATINIPPGKAAWAESVRQQITEATDTHYIYIPVADKEEMEVLEDLAFKQGRSAQRIKRDGKITECVFVLRCW